MPRCRIARRAGAIFFVNDTTTAFGSRMRGFLNVTADLANKPIHFGLYTDDTVSLTVYDKAFTAYPVVVRPAEFGAPTWRVTNEVTFSTPGLYPIEILYTQITEHAALELSYSWVISKTSSERPTLRPSSNSTTRDSRCSRRPPSSIR